MTPVEKAQKAMDDHELTRPDMMKALHPAAPKPLRKAWEKWRDDHDRLRSALDAAKFDARSGWRDAQGNRVKGIHWKAERHNKLTNAAYMEWAKQGPSKGGRPLSKEPSKEALRKRAERAKNAA